MWPAPAVRTVHCAVVALLPALSACTGFHDDLDSMPPRVQVAAPPDALPGETVYLQAAAADDRGIEQVAFYRADDEREVRVGIVETQPYRVGVQMPLRGPARLRFFARAIDNEGNLAQSRAVTVSVAR